MCSISRSRLTCAGSELSGSSQICNRRVPRAGSSVAALLHRERNGDARPNQSILPPAKELSKGWRFFATYTGVQTSPVLRQPSSSA